MTTRKSCTNVPTASYTGKEQSPLHFGLSAEGYELNTPMEGFDHMMWIVKMKNNKKVWVRQLNSAKMTHEEPVMHVHSDTKIDELPEHITLQELNSITAQPIACEQVPIMKTTIVEEKKINNYNLFLTYRLQELKKGKKSSNKELFNSVVAEWKELKKNPDEMNKIMVLVHEFHAKTL